MCTQMNVGEVVLTWSQMLHKILTDSVSDYRFLYEVNLSSTCNNLSALAQL